MNTLDFLRRAIIRHSACLWLVVACLSAVSASAAPKPRAPFTAKPEPIKACPAAVAFAGANHIPIGPIEPAATPDKIMPGDSFTALVTLREKTNLLTQWLLYLEAVPPKTNEAPKTAPKPLVLYGPFGERMEFSSSPVPVTLRTLGPFIPAQPGRKAPKFLDKTARFTVQEGFLRLGLEQAVIAALRLKEANFKGGFGFGDKPPTERQTATNRLQLAGIPISTASMRALAGGGPALGSYFDIVQETESLEDIVFKLLDRPSLWSVLVRGGIQVNFNFILEPMRAADAVTWGLPAAQPIYELPVIMQVNGHSALHINLAVTAPRPPLLTCGGVVALIAEKPNSKAASLTLQILHAHHAPGPW